MVVAAAPVPSLEPGKYALSPDGEETEPMQLDQDFMDNMMNCMIVALKTFDWSNNAAISQAMAIVTAVEKRANVWQESVKACDTFTKETAAQLRYLKLQKLVLDSVEIKKAAVAEARGELQSTKAIAEAARAKASGAAASAATMEAMHHFGVELEEQPMQRG